MDRLFPLSNVYYNDDGIPSDTSIAQRATEKSIFNQYKRYQTGGPLVRNLDKVELRRQKHINFLLGGLEGLKGYMVALDASKPWLIYWIIHSLELLDHELTEEQQTRAISSLAACQAPSGGYGGGPDQVAHLATTYAAVNALATVGTEAAYESINREKMLEFLLSVKNPDGSFCVHHGGEVDIRGSYLALSVAALLNIMTPVLTRNCDACQTFEGGIGPSPGVEAHGGYTFNGLAAIELLGEMHTLNVPKLEWCCARQSYHEGGFQGRTNKLVDGCYSYWVGGLFPLLATQVDQRTHGKSDSVASINDMKDFLLDRDALQAYILLCCQDIRGGLCDKPGKHPDYYHTCYCLSGLTSVQHNVRFLNDMYQEALRQGFPSGTPETHCLANLFYIDGDLFDVVGQPDNLLASLA